jgi:anti-sigma B factor antagonist
VSGGLRIETLVGDAATTLTVVGEVEVFTAQRLVDAFDAALDDGPPWIVLDLQEVSFADSTGLAALIRCRRRAVTRGAELSLACGDGEIRRLLDLSGLAAVFSLI